MKRKQRRHRAAREHRPVTAPVTRPGANAAAIEADLAAAMQRIQEGRLQDAQSILTTVLKAQPSNPVALHLLGVVALQTRRHETAVDLIGKAVALKPDYAEAHYTLGSALMNQGKLEEAAAAYQSAIARRPDYDKAYMNLGIVRVNQCKLEDAIAAFRKAAELAPNVAQVHNNLGSALVAQGEVEAALACYRKAIDLRPDYAEAHFNAGCALRGDGRLDEAVASFQKAIALKPGYAGAHNNLGTALKELGRLDEAVAAYRAAIALNPSDAELYSNLGNALKDLGRLEEAIASHQKAISLKPDFAEAYYNFGAALERQGKLEEAVASYRKAITIRREYAEAHTNLGVVLMSRGEWDEAIASHQQAIALKPDSAGAHNNLGAALRQRGELDEAHACFLRAIEIEPDNPEGHINQAAFHRFCPGDPEIEKLKGLLARGDTSADQRTRIRFALGKAHDDIGRYDQAFSHYSTANEEMSRRGDFDPSRHRNEISEIKKMFRERRGCADENSGDAEHVPVFVVGMSRSGKTSVESLLVQHEAVYGAGESHEWQNAARAVLEKYSLSTPFPEWMGFLSDDQIREIGKIYLENITKKLPDSRLSINTIPGNDLYIGLIFQALPMARIIYCHRDPMDHCLFVYFYRYKDSNDYSYDLSHLGSYYADHSGIMAHWQRLYGDCILSVSYEDLVRNPTDQGARIYEFCGLDYDPKKVSQAFTSDEIGHWKRYEPYLDTLRQALGGLAEHSTRQ